MQVIVNEDFTAHLIPFLHFPSIINMLQLNNQIYQIICFTKIGKDLLHLRDYTHKLRKCIIEGMVTVFEKFYPMTSASMLHPMSNLAVCHNQASILAFIQSRSNERFCILTSSVETAANFNYREVLQWLKQHGYNYNINCYAVQLAASSGDINTLNQLRLDNRLDYTAEVIDKAAANGHLNVLNWFENHRYPILYTNEAIDKAATIDCLAVLNWFENHRYPILYTNAAIDKAASYNQLAVLDWFKNHHYPILYTSAAIEDAVFHNHPRVLHWFENHGFPITYTETIKNNILEYCLFRILNWFYEHRYLTESEYLHINSELILKVNNPRTKIDDKDLNYYLNVKTFNETQFKPQPPAGKSLQMNNNSFDCLLTGTFEDSLPLENKIISLVETITNYDDSLTNKIHSYLVGLRMLKSKATFTKQYPNQLRTLNQLD